MQESVLQIKSLDKQSSMCHKYNVVHSACWHSHERLRVCKDGLTCDDMVAANIIVDHFCDICTSDPKAYKFQDGPSFSADQLSNLKELKAQMKRAMLVTKRIETRMPTGCARPFQGRITRSDLECLKKIEKVLHLMFCKIPVTIIGSGDLQLLDHDTIERAEVDFREDAGLDVSDGEVKSPWWMQYIKGV
jgi:hypothetical protein